MPRSSSAVIRPPSPPQAGKARHFGGPPLQEFGQTASQNGIDRAICDQRRCGAGGSNLARLARLCCILHRVEEARAWLGKAFDPRLLRHPSLAA
jgi:hypothetical protein